MTTLAKNRLLARLISDWCLAQDDLTGFVIREGSPMTMQVELSFGDWKEIVEVCLEKWQHRPTNEFVNGLLGDAAAYARRFSKAAKKNL